MDVQKRIFFLLVVFALLQTYYYYPQLPERLATHFGGSGRPNGWSSKQVFVGLYFGTIALFALVFYVLPGYFPRLPSTLINLPGRDYWLQPERKEETLAYIKKQMLLMGNATLAFIILTFQLTFDANLKNPPRMSMDAFWMILAGFILFTAVWTVVFIKRFYGMGQKRSGSGDDLNFL